MLASLIIMFREVIEAGLIVGIIAAVTRGVRRSGLWIGAGVLSGVLGSCLVAAFVGTIASAFSGAGHEVLNAAILGGAVVMLTWHNVWMARHGRAMALELRQKGMAVAAGRASLFALAFVVAVAVLREGVEVVLFLFGIAVSDGGSGIGLLLGALAGLALGAGVSALTYFGLLTIPPRHLFTVTSTMIAFLAAGMAAQAIAFLEQGGLIAALSATVWNTSHVLSDKSLLGRVLQTLVGYSDRPSQMQLLVYVATLATIFVLMRLLSPRPGQPAVKAS
jgi:high-affinity iron transporter